MFNRSTVQPPNRLNRHVKKSRNLRLTSSHLVCPRCLELLTRDDIEGFGCCPYCDHHFSLDPALEDFLLTPLVRQWMMHAGQQMLDEHHG